MIGTEPPGDAVSRLVTYIQRKLADLASVELDTEYEYASVPVCVIDAVFSMGVRYESTRRTVDEFCRINGWERCRREGGIERSVSELIDILQPFDGRFEEADPFRNRQRTSSRSGITKAEAVYRFAKALRDHGVETMADAQRCGTSTALKETIRIIPGQASGICFSYFRILVGDYDVVKPDRMLRRFVAEATNQRAVSQTHAECLVIEASRRLRRAYPNLTPAVLDNAIWKFQRVAKAVN